jgi:hypothetical protein
LEEGAGDLTLEDVEIIAYITTRVNARLQQLRRDLQVQKNMLENCWNYTVIRIV